MSALYLHQTSCSFLCLFCPLILTLQPAGVRITLQGTGTSAWHPKNALA